MSGVKIVTTDKDSPEAIHCLDENKNVLWTNNIVEKAFDIHIDKKNELIYVGQENGYVSKYDYEGNELMEEQYVDNTHDCFGLGTDDAGWLYFCDKQGSVRKMDPSDLSVQWSFSDPTNEPWGIAVYKDGSGGFVGDKDGMVRKFDGDGNSTGWTYNVGGKIRDLFLDEENGHLYICNGSNIRRITLPSTTPDWTYSTSYGANNAVFDFERGFFYISGNDVGDGVVEKVSLDTQDREWRYLKGSSEISGVGIDLEGYAYARQSDTNNLVKLHPDDGSVVWTYSDLAGGGVTFWSMNCAVVDLRGAGFAPSNRHPLAYTGLYLDPFSILNIEV